MAENEVIIGVINAGKVVKYSIPNTSHQFLAEPAGVFVEEGLLAGNAEVFTLVKEGGNLYITGSMNFNRAVSKEGIQLLQSMFY